MLDRKTSASGGRGEGPGVEAMSGKSVGPHLLSRKQAEVVWDAQGAQQRRNPVTVSRHLATQVRGVSSRSVLKLDFGFGPDNSSGLL